MRLAMAMVAALAATGVQAGTKPAPDYFIEATAALQAALHLAENCPSLKLADDVVMGETTAVIERLQADGYDMSRPDYGMTIPAETLPGAQQGFLAHYDIEGAAPEARVCAAGRNEMAAGTRVGSYLSEN